jgi:L-lactate utilization protein LutC
MTTRAEFLARIRATPRGVDPGLPELHGAPDAPTELARGEERLARLQRECEMNSTVVHRTRGEELGSVVARLLCEAGAETVAATADLGPHLASIMTACLADGLAIAPYDEIAPDRPRAGRLSATVTGCAAAVAATGTIVTTAAGAGRAGALIAPMHVCVVREEQVVDGLYELFSGATLAATGSLFALQSGPSRSADIEKVLILGVHGPGDVHLVLAVD